ncbi:MAG: hypothetical protein AVW06_03770 [Hadesarchaea archaeon DG-33-1]|nr:MAG: hypothetical protein AVW06_03770 [Hadesarchaea archaeon DG-33-1]
MKAKKKKALSENLGVRVFASRASAKTASNRPKASTSAEEKRNPANAKLVKGKKINLKREEELLKAAVFDAMGDGVILFSMNGKIIAVNPALEKMTGYEESEMVGKDAADLAQKLIKSEDLKKAMNDLGTALKGKVPLPRTLTLITKDGREVSIGGDVIVSTTYFIKDEKGKPSVMMLVFKNITERKKAEEVLKRKTEQQQALLSSIPAFVYLKDAESKYIAVNRAFAEKVNVPIDQLAGKTAYDLFPKEQAEHFHADDKRVMSSGKPVMNIEEKFTDAEGKTKWASTSKVPYFDEKGKVVGMVGISWDITERKLVEEVLRESEKKYKLFLESSADGILIADIKTRKFKYVNPSICRMFGYSKEELKRIGVNDIHPKDELEHVISEFDAQARGEKTLAQNIPCLRKDGTIFYADINTTKALIDGRECNIGFFRDITERRKAEEEKTAANKRRIEELEKLYDAAVGRELEMIELKERIRALELKLKEITRKG